jgi:putative endonuclease
MSNIEKGKEGERAVMEYLLEKGYKILERNYRSGHREVDIVAAKDDTVAFVEVKKRNGSDFGLGLESVTEKKKRNIISVARQYIKNSTLMNCNVRFDVASIDGNELRYIENAFHL